MAEDFFRDLLEKDIDKAHVIISGIPYDKGCSCGSGAKDAYDKMRELSSFLPPLSMDGIDLRKISLYDNGNLKIADDNVYESLFLQAENLFKTEKFNLFVGGDHSVSIATEKAFIQHCKRIGKIPAIIHIDAHPDICDIYHDSKYSHACPNRRILEYGLDSQNLVLIGIRGYELQEVEFFKKHPEIKVYNACYIHRNGILTMLKEIQEKFDNRFAVYLSYDIDANDPCFAPGTGTPEAFGLHSLDILEIIQTLFQTVNIYAMDIVEVSPKLDNNDITSWLALKTIYEVFKELIEKKKL